MRLHINKLKLIFPFVLLLMLLAGCWDNRDIEERAVVLALGIDKAGKGAEKQEDNVSHISKKLGIPEERMIELTAHVAVPGRIPLGPQTGGATKNPVLPIQVVGHTMEDAMLNLQQQLADELFLGHLRVIVLSEQVAKDGMQHINDYLRRNSEIRRTASLVVSKEKAAKYMKINPELERVPSLYLAQVVENLVSLGKFPKNFIGLFWSILSSKGQDAYLPYLKIKDEKNIMLNGLAFFSGDKMIGKTMPLEIGLFMALTGQGKAGYDVFVKLPETEELVLVRATKRKTRIKASLKNGKPHIHVKVKYEGEIFEKPNPSTTVKTSGDIAKIEKQMAKKINTAMKKLVKKAQKNQSDIFGFGEYFRAKFPKYWSRQVSTKAKWHEVYQQDLTLETDVSFAIRRVGMKAK